MRERGGQGEALAVWAVWSLTLIAVLATYSRIDAGALYNVKGGGLGGQEQLVKRGTVDWRIPSALYPGLKPVTLVWLLLVVLAAWLLTREQAILRR